MEDLQYVIVQIEDDREYYFSTQNGGTFVSDPSIAKKFDSYMEGDEYREKKGKTMIHCRVMPIR